MDTLSVSGGCHGSRVKCVKRLLRAFQDSQGILKVTASATGKCSIPDIDVFDWGEAFDWENGVWGDDFDEGIIEIIELQYTDESCDDWRAIEWMQQE